MKHQVSAVEAVEDLAIIILRIIYIMIIRAIIAHLIKEITIA